MSGYYYTPVPTGAPKPCPYCGEHCMEFEFENRGEFNDGERNAWKWRIYSGCKPGGDYRSEWGDTINDAIKQWNIQRSWTRWIQNF